MIRFMYVLFILIFLMSLLSNIKRVENFSNPQITYDFFYRKCPSPIPPIKELSDGWQIENETCISPCPNCPYSEITYMSKFNKTISGDTSGNIISTHQNLTKLKILLSKTLTDKKGNKTKIYKTIEVYVDPVAKAKAGFYGISDDEVPIYGISSQISKYIMPLPADRIDGYRFTRFPAQVI